MGVGLPAESVNYQIRLCLLCRLVRAGVGCERKAALGTVRQCDIRRQPILPCQVQRSASRSLRIMIKHLPAMLSRTRRHAGIKSFGLQVSGEVSACSGMLRASAIVTTFSFMLTDKCHLSRVLDQHRMLLKQLLHLHRYSDGLFRVLAIAFTAYTDCGSSAGRLLSTDP